MMSIRVAANWCLAFVVVALPAAAATIAGINYQGVRATAADLGLNVAINSSADTVVWQNSRDRVAPNSTSAPAPSMVRGL
jgi:hypothetical protein